MEEKAEYRAGDTETPGKWIELPEWLNATQAARYLGVERNTLFAAVEAGRLAGYVLAGIKAFKVEDLNTFKATLRPNSRRKKNETPPDGLAGSGSEGAAP